MQFIENQTDLPCTYLCPASDRPAADEILTLDPGARLRLEPFSVMLVRNRDGWEKVVTATDPVIVTGPMVYTQPVPVDEETQIEIGKDLRDMVWTGRRVFVPGINALLATLAIAGILQMVAGGAFVQYCVGALPGAALGALLGDVGFAWLSRPGLAEARRLISSKSRLRTLQIDLANLRT